MRVRMKDAVLWGWAKFWMTWGRDQGQKFLDGNKENSRTKSWNTQQESKDLNFFALQFQILFIITCLGFISPSVEIPVPLRFSNKHGE
jgi:hypothetical protein